MVPDLAALDDGPMVGDLTWQNAAGVRIPIWYGLAESDKSYLEPGSALIYVCTFELYWNAVDQAELARRRESIRMLRNSIPVVLC